ncbi:alginate lyase family protein [Vibrio vulnificus]|uniref:alginate lyase family protein n=1 Tax=Vibrio vulnificus TaxID=672 RepID=UPI00102A9B75|nr:alginate lyase family protein [Vibrio vulnificus]EGQ8022941.1 heparinase [Vibrio vulnificus]EHK9017326.1 alginate lyase family protein [Vibrio vulnificus]EHU4996730.1 alginate lyase family protein [Vibrio vulnificus]RZQ73652.1 heparinase [Vibrio vulnificus]RZQ98731.1 heparinase [Vibrio vulnificus]
MSLKLKAQTAIDLGLLNLARVFGYQLGVRSGLNPVKRLNQASISGLLFRPLSTSVQCESSQRYQFSPFGWKPKQLVSELRWAGSALTGQIYSNMEKPWFSLSDFDSNVGDIKGIWEASRFDWVLGLAKDYLSGREQALDELNATAKDWLEHNPPYLGPNWKCGQEASIRIMHLAMTAKLLNQVEGPEPALLAFVKAHLKRIAPTISYAVAQDNNHGTSEAASLFIGGSWLVSNGDKSAIRWQKMGRKWLENRAKHLIVKDGTFSQYSVNYHRVMLDTYSMAELWRRELDLPPFSKELTKKISLATQWLYQLIDTSTGDAPNLGHNDGARLLQLTDTDYRDFRPSVQLASVLFLQASAWPEDGDYDEPLALLQLRKPQKYLPPPASFHFDQGGYIGLRNQSGAFALFNYPKFRFRPAQNDALHVDLWRDGVNLLRDGGTFSYNAGQGYIDYYGGTQSHNTIQFDGHEQMPRLSRFLLGAWLKAKNVNFDERQLTGKAGYRDYLGCEHHREVSLTEMSLIVVDQVSGVKNKAVLRWRLVPDDWQIQGQKVTNGNHQILINSDVKIDRLEIVEGRESRYYYQESSIPVLEVEISSDGKITTEYQFHS